MNNFNTTLPPTYSNLIQNNQPNFNNYQDNMYSYLLNSRKTTQSAIAKLFSGNQFLNYSEFYLSRWLRSRLDMDYLQIERALQSETRNLNVDASDDGKYINAFKGELSSSILFPILQRKKARFSNIDFYLNTLSIYPDTSSPIDVSQAKTPNDLPSNTKLTYWNNHIENDIKKWTASTEYQQLLDNAFSYGNGFVFINWKKNIINENNIGIQNDGKIDLQIIHPRQVFPDLNTTSIQKSTFIYIVQRTTKQQLFLNQKYFKNNELFADNIEKLKDILLGVNYDTIAEYEVFKDILFLNDAEIIDLYNNKVDLTYRFSRTGDNKVRVEHYAGMFKIYEEIIDSDLYPLVALYDIKDNRSFFGTSGLIKSLTQQKKLNTLESILITVLEHQALPLYSYDVNKINISPKQFQDYVKNPNAALAVNGPVEDAILSIQKQFPIEPLLEEIEYLKNSIWETCNVNKVNMGESSASQNSSSGYSQLLATSSIVDNDTQVYLNQFILDLAKNIMKTYRAYIDKSYNLLVPNNNINGIINGKYISLDKSSLEKDIQISFATEPMTPTQKDKNYNRLLQMLGIGNPKFQNITTPLELLKMSNASTPAQINRLQMDNTLIVQQKSVEIVELVSIALQTNILAEQSTGKSNINPQQLISIVEQIISGDITDQQVQQILQQLQQEQQSIQQQAQQQQQQAQQNPQQQPEQQPEQQPNNSGGAVLQNQQVNAIEGINNEGTGQ